MDVDRCRDTVFVQERLRRSLASRLGGEVVSMQRCVLAVGHQEPHSGVPGPDGRALLRWEGRGIRLSETTYGDGSTAGESGGRHAAHDGVSEVAGHHDDALWAMAATLDRLTDVISAALDRTAAPRMAR